MNKKHAEASQMFVKRGQQFQPELFNYFLPVSEEGSRNDAS